MLGNSILVLGQMCLILLELIGLCMLALVVVICLAAVIGALRSVLGINDDDYYTFEDYKDEDNK